MSCERKTLSNNNSRCSTTRTGVDDQAVQTLLLRASAVADLANALDEELARIDSSALLGDMELPVQRVLAQLEATGIAIDTDLLASCRVSSPT